MTNLNIMTEPAERLYEKLGDLNIFIEDSLDSLHFAYDRQKAYRSAYMEAERFSSELAYRRQARDFVSETYRKAEGLYYRKMDELLLAYEEELTEGIEDLSRLLPACSAEISEEPAGRIRTLLDLDPILASVEEIHAERKAESPLNPLQSYLDQVIYEEDRFAETCEDNLFLKQLGKLFRFYGYQARPAVDLLRTDIFTQYLAFRTVFILQANAWIRESIAKSVLELLPVLREEPSMENTDTQNN